MPSAVVVICTHNRAARLAATLGAVVPQARALDAEVLVVDNASTDPTAETLAALTTAQSETLRVVRETRLGLSQARNRALHESGAPLIVFLDDDAVPRPGWLAALLRPFDDPRVAGVGGRIVLAFDAAPPAWLGPSLHGALSAFDMGDGDRALHYGRANYPHGANMAFRRAALRRVGEFSLALGLHGRRQRQHEETDLFYRLERAGGTIFYAARAVVDHHIEPERLTPDWFLTRHWCGGQSAAHFIFRNRGLLRALWRVQWWYGKHLLRVPYHPRAPIDADRLLAECQRREALGYVVELARLLPALPRARPAVTAPPVALRP